jgi:predicted SAM-dependent methyltransferase
MCDSESDSSRRQSRRRQGGADKLILVAWWKRRGNGPPFKKVAPLINLSHTLSALMRQLIERIEKRFDPLKRSRQTFWYLAHRFGMWDRKFAERYILQSKVRKLHLGCGWNLLPGWLNVDYIPERRGALYLDARRPFFFKDETFDFIFSEHMIEHMSYHDGLNMLGECHRILKRHGNIRIATPDLAFLIALYRDDKSSLQRDYIAWANHTFVRDAPEDNEVFVINNFMRDWGHMFIYNENTLRTAMINAGFADIVKCELRKSKHDALCNLESLARIPTKFLELETITLEGTKTK